MHYSRIALAATPVLFSTVYGYGNSIIENKCGNDVYFWEDKGVANPPLQTITPGNKFSKPLYQTGKAAGAGPSFKITTAGKNGKLPVFNECPITQFEYTVNAPNWPGVVSFDISNVDGGGLPPFVDGGVQVTSPQDQKATKTCKAGQNPCTEGYTLWNDDKWAMVQTDQENDIVMILCGPKPGTVCGGGGKSTSGGGDNHQEEHHEEHHEESQPAPAPSSPAPEPSSQAPPPSSPAAAPATTPAAVIPQQKNVVKPGEDDDTETKIVVVTEYAKPQIVTLTATVDGAPPHKEKRAEHIHQHAHAHNKINKRRHGA